MEYQTVKMFKLLIMIYNAAVPKTVLRTEVVEFEDMESADIAYTNITNHNTRVPSNIVKEVVKLY